MRILFVSHHFPPAHTAGTETYTFNLAGQLRKRHDVAVFHTEKRLGLREYTLLEEEVAGIRTRVLINNLCQKGFRETYLNPRAEDAFARVLDEFKPDVVHVHHLMFTSLKLPVIAAKRNLPVVMTLHDFYLICPRHGRLMLHGEEICPGPDDERCPDCLSNFKYCQTPWERRMIYTLAGIRSTVGLDLTGMVYKAREMLFKGGAKDRAAAQIRGGSPQKTADCLPERIETVRNLFSCVDRFMVPSETVAGAMKSAGLAADKIKLWRYGIDTAPLKRVERPSRKTPVFGFLGTLVPHKGVMVLVEAAASLKPGTAATVVRGTSVHDPEYARELEKAACQDTEFKPAYSRDEAGDAFAEIDVLVLPSLWLENSPVVIQEAFATGCPVLTSDLGGMRELVQDGVNGRLFPPGDAKALAKIMEEVCSNPGMIDKWREGITPPRPIEDDAESIEALYGELLRR